MIDGNWVILFDGLKNNTTIQSLDLIQVGRSYNSGCSQRLIAKIAELLEKNIFLESFELKSCCLGERNCKALWDAIQKNESLTKLNLSRNFIKDFQELEKTLRKPPNNLVELKLSGNHFSGKNLKSFLSSLLDNKKLQTLRIGNTELDAECMKLIGEFITQKGANSVLTELLLSNRGDVDFSRELFFDHLIKNKSLKKLDIGWGITRGSSELIWKLIKENNCLEFLDIGVGRRMPPASIRMIFEALKTNSALTQLDMNRNSLNNEGAFQFAEMLKHNRSLKTVNLECNGFGIEGLQAIFEEIGNNTTITDLNLYQIDQLDVKKLKDFYAHFKRNQTITKLKLLVGYDMTKSVRKFRIRISANKDFSDREKSMWGTFVAHDLGHFFQDVTINYSKTTTDNQMQD